MQPNGFESLYTPCPNRIGRLRELAYNFWWAWNPEAQLLFSDTDPQLWEAVNHNPVRFLREVRQDSLEKVCDNQDYVGRYDKVIADFEAYMKPAQTWTGTRHPELKDTIAYFAFEFGLHETLPIYSGGLGILSGDHMKEASDMALPFVGVGYIYPQGYFRQAVNREGWQEAYYEKMNFADVPALPALNQHGREVVVGVEMPGRTIYAKVYKIQVGRIPLYLLDTDIHPNAPPDRQLSSRLYGGDQEMRVAQEVVLGIGGVRALRALGYEPTVWHMNEGHTAFLTLELARELVEQGKTFEEARQEVSERSVFTTHTPVAAGNDAFPFELIDKFFSSYWPRLGLSQEEFHRLGWERLAWGANFSMTVLALNMTKGHNGVSELHGKVSRRMWNWLWPNKPEEQTPIGYITNGVHTATWLAQELRELYAAQLGPDWYDRIDDPALWERLRDLSDEQLWELHTALRKQMIAFTRERVTAWHKRTQAPLPWGDLLTEDALTIGFARRFATYKRATLLFSDPNRLLSIIHNQDRPVQFVFAGKAHPADQPGKEFIQRVIWASENPQLANRLVFVEDYDMNVARYLVHGVDVWLNTPRKPYEASGTSGMKAAINGAPNLSILDGWWAEGYNGKNGWAIGKGPDLDDQDAQDRADAESLYWLLENEVAPAFYERDEQGIPRRWLQYMKEAIISCAPQFSTRRMLTEYTEKLYIPASQAPISQTERAAWEEGAEEARASDPAYSAAESEGFGG